MKNEFIKISKHLENFLLYKFKNKFGDNIFDSNNNYINISIKNSNYIFQNEMLNLFNKGIILDIKKFKGIKIFKCVSINREIEFSLVIKLIKSSWKDWFILENIKEKEQ